MSEGLEANMNHNVGIWIDHKRAVIVWESGGGLDTRTLESDFNAHPRYSSEQHDGGEKKYEQRHGEQLDRYYDDVIGQLGQPETLLIFGPGEAKLQLKARLARSKVLSLCPVEIETTDKLTDPQILAKVRDYFNTVRGVAHVSSQSVRDQRDLIEELR